MARACGRGPRGRRRANPPRARGRGRAPPSGGVPTRTPRATRTPACPRRSGPGVECAVAASSDARRGGRRAPPCPPRGRRERARAPHRVRPRRSGRRRGARRCGRRCRGAAVGRGPTQGERPPTTGRAGQRGRRRSRRTRAPAGGRCLRRAGPRSGPPPRTAVRVPGPRIAADTPVPAQLHAPSDQESVHGSASCAAGEHPGRDAEDLHATGGDSLHEVSHRVLDADAVEVLRPAGYPCTRKFKEP